MSTATTIAVVKEHPILFGAEMVLAIRAGAKTQTRRTVKPQPHMSTRYAGVWFQSSGRSSWRSNERRRDVHRKSDGAMLESSEYLMPLAEWLMERAKWKVGERLWVRETWCPRSGGALAMDRICAPRYRADEELRPEWGFRWRSSIHMPRWASRITLEITDVRVQRLQEISEEDAIAEGVGHGFQMNAGWPDYGRTVNGVSEVTQDTARMSYATLWDRINGAGAWDSDPFVWCISFKPLPAEVTL